MKNKIRRLLFILLCLLLVRCDGQKNKKVVNFDVGVILDKFSTVGLMGMSCLLMAQSDFYANNSNYSTRLILHLRDSKGEVLRVAGSALNLLNDVEVDAIIGPQKSGNANFVINLGDQTHTPIVSFSATSPSLHTGTKFFVQTALSDEAQVGAIAATVKAFKWSKIVLIYEDSDYGNGIIPYLANALQEVNARVSYRSVISVTATEAEIQFELTNMKTMPTRIFIVHVGQNLSDQIFVKAKEIGMMEPGFVWIVTSSIIDLLSTMDPKVVEAMEGIIGVKPQIPKTEKLESFKIRWKKEFILNNPTIINPEVSIYGLWAYDTYQALAMAVEKVGTKDQTTLIAKNKTDQFNLTMSKVGGEILKALLDTSFEGLNGKFHLLNGQLAPPSFQILNIVDSKEKEVGIWTPSLGINRIYPNITWPGRPNEIPKGWEVPIKGEKLKVGVPAKAGFPGFLEVKADSHNNSVHNISGYYVDIFDSVMKSLNVPYDFVPFNGSYNALVEQVLLQNFDCAMGDITITSNRSKYVDFTLPFEEGGIATIIKAKSEDINRPWGFLKPLKKELWLTSLAFFVFTGVAIWILEHRKNPAFRGTFLHQLGMVLYFPFTTLIFGNREKIVGNLTRIVVVVWIFVVLILTATYTASLSSRLTSQKLQSVKTLTEIRHDGSVVGCRTGSFIYDRLKTLGFPESQIKTCGNYEDCHQALSLGSNNGGIDAFLGVVPYIKLFLSKYDHENKNYEILSLIYRTDGFAYAFVKGSPLVSDVSRAIINLTESNILPNIQKKWFSLNYTASAPPNVSTTVSLQSFKYLFYITGSVTGICIFLYIINYYFQNTDNLHRIWRSNSTISKKMLLTSKHFDEMDQAYLREKDKDKDDESPRLNTHPSQIQFITIPSFRRSFR